MPIATELRLAGRWQDALDELAHRDDPEALVERVLVLADENMLARDRSSDLAEAIDAVEMVARARGDRRLEAFALARRGLALHTSFLDDRSRGEPPGQLDYFERALELRRELGDERGIAESLFHVGLLHQVVRGDHETSRPLFEESYERASALGDDILASYALRHVAFCDEEAGDLDAAERRHSETLELRRRVGWIPGEAAQLLAVAGVRAQRGRRDEALEMTQQACDLLRVVGGDRVLVFAEAQLAELRSE